MNMKINTPDYLKKLAASLLLVGTLSALHAADATGTWTWSTPGRNGGADRVSTLTLKVESSQLTGQVSSPGRDGKSLDLPIVNGKVDGDKISFGVIRAFNGQSSTNTYTGTVTADKITGKIDSVRNGEPQSHDWEAKRAVTVKP